MIDLLMEVHTNQNIRLNREVSPEDVPVTSRRIGLDTPAQLLSHLTDHGVLSHYIMRAITRDVDCDSLEAGRVLQNAVYFRPVPVYFGLLLF